MAPPTVLHLVNQASPAASPAGLMVLRDWLARTDQSTRLLLIGDGQFAERARQVGVGPFERLPSAGGRMLPAVSGLRRWLRRFESGVIHCWSCAVLQAAQFHRPRTPKLLSLTSRPCPDDLRRLRRAISRSKGQVQITTPTASVNALLREHVAGLEPDQVTTVRPTLQPPAEPAVDRARLVTRLNLDELAEPPRLVALLSDPPPAGDAQQAMLAVGLARETLMSMAARRGEPGRELVLLVHPNQHRRSRAQQSVRQLGRPHVLQQAPELACPWRLLPVCDAALVMGEQPAAVALAHGLTHTIAADHPGNRELMTPTDQVFTAGEPKRAAHALSQLPAIEAGERPEADGGASAAVASFDAPTDTPASVCQRVLNGA